MPVLKSLTSYRSKGRHRTVRLYRAWHNMQGRIKGTTGAGNGSKPWVGLICEWRSFAEFRAWALASGFSRVHNSLDRYPNPTGNYGPNNCRWVTRAENTSYMRAVQLGRSIVDFLREPVPF